MSGGSSSGNDAIIAQQQADAATAERKENERQARLKAGRERIQAMFSEGGGTWSGPGSYTTGLVDPNASQYTMRYRGQPTNRYEQELANSGQWSNYERVANPNYGKTTQVWKDGETQTESGIGEDFYGNFKKSITDYYTPDVNNQFEEAKDANLFDLARRGMLRSSVAADHASELTREKAEADARVAADAENQTAGLRTDISNAQQNALSLLQATEDPTAAANAALTETNAIQSRSPNLSALGDLFSAAARSYAGWQNTQNAKRAYGAAGSNNPYSSAGRVIGG